MILGETKRPLYYLVVGGVINVVLNVILVAGFHLDVAGVAIATVVPQLVSAGLTIHFMVSMDEELRLKWREIRITRSKLLRILRIGLPAGIQSTIFSFSNVLIQSSINGFGELACFFGTPLLEIYLPDNPQAIRYGLTRMEVIAATYFLCALYVLSVCETEAGEIKRIKASYEQLSLLQYCNIN